MKDGFTFEITDITMMKPYKCTSDKWIAGVVYKRCSFGDEKSGYITFTIPMEDFVANFTPVSLEIGDMVELVSMGKSRGVIEVYDVRDTGDEYCVLFANRNEMARQSVDAKTGGVDVINAEQATDYYIYKPQPTNVSSIDDIIKRLHEYKRIVSNSNISEDVEKIMDNISTIRNLMNI